MRRPLLWGMVCGLGLVVSTLPSAGAEPIRRKVAERREAVEKLLDQPLEWELDDREQVTLEELIQHIRERHGLSIRWDAATFQMLGQAGGAGLLGHSARPPVSFPSASYLQSPCPPGSNCPAPLNAYPSDVQYFPSPPLGVAPSYAAPAVALSGEILSPDPVPVSKVAPSGVIFVAAGSPAAGGSPVATPASQSIPPERAAKPPATKIETPSPKAVPVATPAAVVPKPGSTPAAVEAPQTVPAEPIPVPNPLPPAVGAPAAVPTGDAAPAKSEPAKTDEAETTLYRQFASIPIAREALAFEGATIGEALRQMLDVVIPPIGSMGEEIGIPIVTRAMTLDYVIEGSSVVITTQLRANTRKETRVYRIGELKTLPPESLARVITHTVRPWSWRSQSTEIAEQLAARWPKGDLLKLPLVSFDGVEALSGIKLTSGQAVSPDGTAVSPADAKVTDEAIAATGQLLAGGAVATVQSIVAALEIVHHGDPPTGVIESLPGMLVITQSQGAHREIAALLDELSGSAEPK